MDIETFYDENPARRSSAEYTFGQDWTDADGTRWELNWVQDTAEVYLMCEPNEPIVMDPLGDTAVADLPTEQVTVEVLGRIEGLEAVETAFGGWSDAERTPGSVQWVRSRMDDVDAGVTHTAHAADAQPDSLPGGA